MTWRRPHGEDSVVEGWWPAFDGDGGGMGCCSKVREGWTAKDGTTARWGV